MQSAERAICGVALCSRVLVLVLGLFADAVLPDYDRSSASAVHGASFSFVKWDAVFNVDLALHGYRFEQQFAFQPLLPLGVRGLAYTLLLPLHRLLPHTAVVAFAGILLCNASFVLAAVMLYRLGVVVMRDEPLSYRAAILFCFSPASIFMSSIYTESLFALFSFHGLLLLHKHYRFFAAVAFALATATRANGVLLVGFFLFEAIQLTASAHSIGKAVLLWIRTLLYSGVVLWPNVLFQWWAYNRFCNGSVEFIPARPYCSTTIPSIYSFVQQEYWNNGFLRYWQWKQLPNFLLASPLLLTSFYGIFRYLRVNTAAGLSAGLLRRQSSPAKRGFAYVDQLCYIYHWAIATALLVFFFHIQIATRFLSAFPSLYWFVASLCSGEHARRNAAIFLSYSLVYIVVGTIMFVNFFPWT